MERVKHSIKNVRYAVIGQAVALLISFIARRIFLLVLSADYLGLSGLFDNVLKMLSLAELGVGAAITFSLYKPLALEDHEQVNALMALYKKAYMLIGLVVGVLGAAITPFLPMLIKQMPDVPSIRLIYLMFVANSAFSYFFVYKRSLIMADQKRYIATLYRYGFFCGLTILQIIILVVTRDYLLYLLLQIIFTLAENIAVSYKADRMYPYMRHASKKKLDAQTYKTIKNNVFAMVFHKVGGIVVFGTDSILLSRMVGLSAVGLYSNYYLITNALNTIYSLLYQSVTASVGNLGVTADKDKLVDVFNKVNFFTAWLYGFSFVCLINLFNPFISLWVGEAYLFPPPVVITISISFYLTGMRKGVLTFREALGLYWYDRYKPIFEALINLGASIWLGMYMGTAGILLGTIISTLATCFWMEPCVLYRYGFARGASAYFKQYLLFASITAVATAVVFFLCRTLTASGIVAFILRCLICLCVSNGIFFVALHQKKEFHYFRMLCKSMLR